MTESYNNLPDHIKKHLESVTKTSGLPQTDDSLNKIAEIWLEKDKKFSEQIKLLDMIEVGELEKDSKKAALILTYSGSLISLGAAAGNKRWVEYASIQLRNDVPNLLKQDDAELLNDINVNNILEFKNGPLKSTSSLYKVSVCGDDVSIDEQERRIREATIFLTNSFIKINRTILQLDKDSPELFNQKSIIAYLASKNSITQKQAKQILDDYYLILESGMILGERVPLGKMGKLFIKKKPAQKARVGINPKTGEKITISAKPEIYTPKINFNKSIKEKVANIEIE